MSHVPYKSGPQAMNDVVAAHVPLMFADPGSAVPQVREGKVRALGVTSLAPMPSAPNIPPLANVGVPGFDAVSWQIMLAPAQTPIDIISKLNSEVKRVLAMPYVAQRAIDFGMIPARSLSPEESRRFAVAEIGRWREIVRKAGVEGSQ